LNGARLVVLCRDTLLSPPALAAAIERHGITTLFLTTALFNQMAERIPGALAKLNCLLFGGESADPQTVRALLEKAPPKRLLHVYGPTESTTFASWYWVKTLAADAPAVPIGKPIANTQIYILDPALNPVPAGVRGEIYIGGDGLARHYFNRPELSAARFIANPFSREPGARLYKTGDQARYLPDGNIEFIGRLDGQVKIRGHRIEPGEIEATLIQHPAVKECAVAAEQEPESGSEDNRRLAAYVAASETLAPTAHELRRFLKQKLPDYMIPSAFLFVETMPLTPNGKIDRKALPSVANKWPAALDTAQAAPKTITEETVAGIWLELLKLERVGMHENFFDLGGHSLLAIELLERIRRQFGIELPVRAIFDAPTVAGLAARLDAQTRGKLPDSIQIKNSFSFLVELHRGNGQAPLFMIPGGFGREDELLALGRLARAMGEDRRCYGMRARSAGRTEPAHSDVGEMAAEYLKEVRAVQPEGPYYLVGECVAGAVAYEMARQLRAGGQAVGVLALLDATCPNRVRYLKYRANLVLKKYVRRASRLLHGRNGSSRKNEKLRDRAHYKRISSPVVVGNERRGGKSNIPGWFQPSVKRSYLDVLQRCRPESYEGPLTLFYAKETNRQATIKKWKKLVPGAVEICYVPGDHETYIREHVDVLAKQLRLCLDKAAATSSDDSLREAGGPNLRHPGIVAVDQGAG
jgi:thioesterase domain-containing protein/acyl carrier protein